MDNQLGEGRVEGSVRKRQMFRRCDFDGDPGQALSNCVDELLGWVDGSHAGRAQPADELGRERPRSATDVEHALRTCHACKGSHLRSEKN